jgi:hypothetical protein
MTPTIGALKALYEVGFAELSKSDVVITFSTSQNYSIEDLKQQIQQDSPNLSTYKRSLTRLKREFILWTHHLKRKV